VPETDELGAQSDPETTTSESEEPGVEPALETMHPRRRPSRLEAAERGEGSLALLACQDGAPGAHDAGRVQVLGVLLDIDQHDLLRNPVQDVLGPHPATLAGALLAA
jgi:hypothetical protein